MFRYVVKMPYLCEDLSDFLIHYIYNICVSLGGYWHLEDSYSADRFSSASGMLLSDTGLAV